MSIRHQKLRDAYFKALNALILDACINWQKEQKTYNPKDPPRTDYFLEHVIEVSGRPFWRRARAGVEDLEKAAVLSRLDYERFLNRIKPFASESQIDAFQTFIENTFLEPELVWNFGQSTLRDLNEVFEEIGIRRMHSLRHASDPERALALSEHIEFLYHENKFKAIIESGLSFVNALVALQEQTPQSTEACEAFYIHALPIPIILNSLGVDMIAFPVANATWIREMQSLIAVNYHMAQGTLTPDKTRNALNLIDSATIFFDTHQQLVEPDISSKRLELHNSLLPAFRRMYGYDTDEPLGVGIAIPVPHPLLNVNLMLTRTALYAYYQNPEVHKQGQQSTVPFLDALELDSQYIDKLKGHPFRRQIIGTLYCQQASLHRWYKNDYFGQLAGFMELSKRALRNNRSAAVAAEFYAEAANYMNFVGNAHMEALAWRKVSALCKKLGAKNKMIDAQKKADHRSFNPLPARLPMDRRFHDELGLLIQSEQLFW